MLFLSQTAALAIMAATIGAQPTVKPVPYAHLDFSRAVNPQYDIMMQNIESMTPKQSSLEWLAKRAKKNLDSLEDKPKTLSVKYAPPDETKTVDAVKLIVVVLGALFASGVILTYAARRKVS
jgi:hypothetical protein